MNILNQPSTFRILVGSDAHTGSTERDPFRCDDSFRTLEEFLALAVEQDVDFVLFGGDLFDTARPSSSTLYRVTNLLRKYCLGDKPIRFELLSDQKVNFPRSGVVNYEDPDMNIQIPFFTIHGNHDDQVGKDRLSCLDILSSAHFVNYFGCVDNVETLSLSPLLLEKGNSRIALYGLGYVRDERLVRLFTHGNVRLLRPESDTDSWFNILVVHQNRVVRGAEKGTRGKFKIENFIPSWVHIVVWGHEHECRIIPEEIIGSAARNETGGGDGYQPQSAAQSAAPEIVNVSLDVDMEMDARKSTETSLALSQNQDDDDIGGGDRRDDSSSRLVRNKTYVVQPGSFVHTQYTREESKSKHVGVLEVTHHHDGDPGDYQFKMTPLQLKTVRPLIFDEISLIPREQEVDRNEMARTAAILSSPDRVEKYLKQVILGKVSQYLATLPPERVVNPEDGGILSENAEFDRDQVVLPPLVRLRVEYDQNAGTTCNPQRLGQSLVGQIANPGECILFYRRKKKIVRKKQSTNAGGDAMETETDDVMNGDAKEFDLRSALGEDFEEENPAVTIDSLISQNLTRTDGETNATQSTFLNVLPLPTLMESVSEYVVREDRHAVDNFIDEMLEKVVDHTKRTVAAQNNEDNNSGNLRERCETMISTYCEQQVQIHRNHDTFLPTTGDLVSRIAEKSGIQEDGVAGRKRNAPSARTQQQQAHLLDLDDDIDDEVAFSQAAHVVELNSASRVANPNNNPPAAAIYTMDEDEGEDFSAVTTPASRKRTTTTRTTTTTPVLSKTPTKTTRKRKKEETKPSPVSTSLAISALGADSARFPITLDDDDVEDLIAAEKVASGGGGGGGGGESAAAGGRKSKKATEEGDDDEIVDISTSRSRPVGRRRYSLKKK